MSKNYYKLIKNTCTMVYIANIVAVKARIHLQTFVHQLHRVQEPICEHDVRVIRTYKRSVCEQFVSNHLHRFFNEHKCCSQFSGYDVCEIFINSLTDYQEVKALQGPFVNKNVRKCISSLTCQTIMSFVAGCISNEPTLFSNHLVLHSHAIELPS